MRKYLQESGSSWPFKTKRIRGWLLLLLAMLMFGSKANAHDINNSEKYKVTISSDGTSAHFVIPFYDSTSSDDHTADGNIYVQYDGRDHLIINYWSWDQEKSNYSYGAKCFKGVAYSGETLINTDDHHFVADNQDSEDLSYMDIWWYCPADLAGKSISFKLSATFDEYGSGTVDPSDLTDYNFGNASGTVKNFSNPTLQNPILSNTPGCFDVSYSTTDEPTMIQWSNTGEYGTSDRSGTHQFEISDDVQDCFVQIKYKMSAHVNSNFYRKSTTLPAFHQAKNFAAENVIGGDTKLTWSIAETGRDNCIEGDRFEVQRALDNQFLSPVTVGSVDFHKNKTNYELLDQTGKDNINGTIYYRIRRTKQPSWNWTIAQQCAIGKSMSHCYINELTAEQKTNASASEGIQIKVSWKLDQVVLDKVWSDGSRIVVEQVNVTDNKTTSFEVSDQDMRNGYVYDNIYVTCKNYKYYAYVRPGNKNFETQERMEADYPEGEIKPILIGLVESLTASKGYYPERTELYWETDGNPIDRFSVEWRVYDVSQRNTEAGFTTLPNGSVQAVPGQTNYSLTDSRGNPGVVYEYRIVSITE